MQRFILLWNINPHPPIHPICCHITELLAQQKVHAELCDMVSPTFIASTLSGRRHLMTLGTLVVKLNHSQKTTVMSLPVHLFEGVKVKVI